MRNGHWRGLGLAVALFGMTAADASAQHFISDFAPWVHTIPRVTYARDLRTGGLYYAPPVPYGHYAKDHGSHVAGALGAAGGALHGLKSKLSGAVCGACGGSGLFNGAGCGTCGGSGLLGHGGGVDAGHGYAGGGHGYAGGGHGYADAGLFGHGGGGLFGHKDGAVHGAGFGGHACDGLGNCGHGLHATPQSSPIVTGSAQGGLGHHGGGLFGKGGRGIAGPCGGCGGVGCGLCGGGFGNGGFGNGGLCGGCGGAGCGLCGGLGRLGNGGGFGNGGLCNACGGAGCGLCSGLGGKLGGALGYLKGLHPKNQVRYFNGAGGPVPLTPGYVPYINVTRSPRDFFAFPPFSDRAFE